MDVLRHEIDERDPLILSWPDLAEDNLDEEVELLRELAPESSAEEAYLNELAQQEEINILFELDEESWDEEAYVDTLARREDAHTLFEVQQEDLYERAYLSMLKQERNNGRATQCIDPKPLFAGSTIG